MIYTSCFVGVVLPEKFAPELTDLSEKLREIMPSLAIADTSTPHITVYYLSKQSQEHLEGIGPLVEEATPILKGESITVDGWGVFDPENPRVVFAKPIATEALTNLNKILVQKLKNYRAENNNYGFHPHITLARVREEDREEFQAKKPQIEKLLNGIHWEYLPEEIAIYGVDSRVQPEKQSKLITFKI